MSVYFAPRLPFPFAEAELFAAKYEAANESRELMYKLMKTALSSLHIVLRQVHNGAAIPVYIREVPGDPELNARSANDDPCRASA